MDILEFKKLLDFIKLLQNSHKTFGILSEFQFG